MQRSLLRSWAHGLCFLAATCFFLASMLDGSTLALVAGIGNFVLGCLMFNSTYRVVFEPREEDRELEPWGWKP